MQHRLPQECAGASFEHKQKGTSCSQMLTLPTEKSKKLLHHLQNDFIHVVRPWRLMRNIIMSKTTRFLFTDPSQWRRPRAATSPQQAKSPSDNSHPVSQTTDRWDTKFPPEEPRPARSSPAIEPAVEHHSQEEHAPILPYYDHHGQEEPGWCCEASQDPCQTNSHSHAIGRGSFYKHLPRDYTDKEHDLPQGHEDYIRINLHLDDAKRCADA